MPVSAQAAFAQFFSWLVSPGVEGSDLSLEPTDPGNWTGGKQGSGNLGGSKYGISSKSYPKLDIKSLTQDQASAIYLRDYWNACNCDSLPPALAFLTADAAVQHGPAQAVKLLQRALGVTDDGVMGPATIAAARVANNEAALEETIARRIRFYMNLPSDQIKVEGLGWARRLASLCRQVM